MSRDAKKLIVCVAALAVTFGCSDPAPTGGPGTDKPAVPDSPVAPKPDAAVEAVKALADGLDDKVRATVEGALTAEAGRAWLANSKPKRRSQDSLRWRTELVTIYAESDLGLLKGGGLSASGEIVRSALVDAGSHGLKPRRYHTEDFDAALKKLAAAQTKADGHPKFKLSDAARPKVEALARELKAPTEESIVTALLADGSPAPELKKSADAYRELLADRAKAAAQAEILLADGLMSYAYDMRYDNQAWFPDIDFPNKRENAIPLLRERLARDLSAARGPKLTGWVEGLAPGFEQYGRLREALAKYRAMEEAGGWKKVGRIPGAKKGRRHKNIVALKKRLAIEGYYELGAEPTDEFGAPLDKAVRRYQETHQLAVDGTPNRWFWKSVNTPLAERIQQIEINLRRWRATRIGPDPYYIHVNIPDFHAEVWNEAVLEYRYRVIVGSRTVACDRDTGRIARVNATPLFSDKMEMIILNPYWNVPERIFKEEIIPEMLKSPTYLEDEGYECMATDPETGLCKRVRQSSGENNALGQLKFIFPNQHSVYMHDTAKKRLFDLPIRAFSHGCMRVHEPMKLAEKLLKNDGQWDKKEVDKILGHGKEHGIRLKKHIPVHIEYYTVRVDDDGGAHFLADVYRYDREIITGESSVGAKCEAEPLAELVVEPESQPDSAAAEGDGTPTDGPTPEDGAAPKLDGVLKPKVGLGLNLPGLPTASDKAKVVPQPRKLDRAVQDSKKKDGEDGEVKVDDIGP
jgi:L,D-transpeptidase YcbB